MRWFAEPLARARAGRAGRPRRRRRRHRLRCPRSARARSCCSRPSTTQSLATLRRAQVRKVVDLWAERTEALLARPEIEYVLVFENRGREVGATIDHPHGQIYGYPFVPPAPAREAAVRRADGCAVCREVDAELAAGARDRRATHGDWVAWVPFASAYAYGMRLAPATHVGSLPALDDTRARRPRARCSSTRSAATTGCGPRRSDGYRFPYLLWFHQAPAAGGDEWHVHAHIAPPLRAPGVPRYVASGELGSGTLSNPVVPEAAARGAARRLSRTSLPRARARVNLIGGQVDYHEGWVVSMAIDRDVVVAARTARRRARRRALARPRRAPSTSPPTAATIPQRGRSPRGAARSPASSACSPTSAATPVGADLDDHVDGADRRRPVVERGVRGRGRARARRRGRTFALAGATSRSPRSAPSTSRPACRAASRTRWRRCSGGAGHALLPRLPDARDRAAPAPAGARACSSCTRAFRARSKAAPYAQRRAESNAVADRLGLRVLARRDARPGARRAARPPRRHRDGAGARVRRRAARTATSTRSAR